MPLDKRNADPTRDELRLDLDSGRHARVDTALLREVSGWGRFPRVDSFVREARTEADLKECFSLARSVGRTVCFRGRGRSYGDAAVNSEQIVVSTERMNRILEFDPFSGEVVVEPGVTIRELWQHVLPHGFWPPVVPGTMEASVGGCISTNIHGKNCYHRGYFGDHLLSLDLLLPNGTVTTVTPETEPELFSAVPGGLGMLGCVLRARLQMKRVDSSELVVSEHATSTLGETLAAVDAGARQHEYSVAWIDGLATGRSLGRGVVHVADDTDLGVQNWTSGALADQELPARLGGVIPRSFAWRLLKPFLNRSGMRVVNEAKYHLARHFGPGKPYRQSHAAFHFLLDYLPEWRRAYDPFGLVQYQSFVPMGAAERVFAGQLESCRVYGAIPLLGVIKRHRSDDAMLGHGVDGFSLALDFKLRSSDASELKPAVAAMNREVLDAGGKFYLAKDALLTSDEWAASIGTEVVDRFMALKRRCDPEGLISSDLYRRLFRPVSTAHVELDQARSTR